VNISLNLMQIGWRLFRYSEKWSEFTLRGGVMPVSENGPF